MKNITTFIFDFDGTIADSIIGIKFAVNKTLKDYKIDKEYSKEEIASFVGNGALVLFFKAFGYKELTIENRDIYNDFMANYEKYQIDNVEVYEHISDLFEFLNKENISIMVYSNKPDKILKRCIKRLFPSIVFKAVVGMKEGYKPKPNPEMLSLILKKEQINTNEVIYVGDSLVDIEFARNLNVNVISALYGYGDIKAMQKENVLAFAKSSGDLLDITKKLINNNKNLL